MTVKEYKREQIETGWLEGNFEKKNNFPAKDWLRQILNILGQEFRIKFVLLCQQHNILMFYYFMCLSKEIP